MHPPLPALPPPVGVCPAWGRAPTRGFSPPPRHLNWAGITPAPLLPSPSRGVGGHKGCPPHNTPHLPGLKRKASAGGGVDPTSVRVGLGLPPPLSQLSPLRRVGAGGGNAGGTFFFLPFLHQALYMPGRGSALLKSCLPDMAQESWTPTNFFKWVLVPQSQCLWFETPVPPGGDSRGRNEAGVIPAGLELQADENPPPPPWVLSQPPCWADLSWRICFHTTPLLLPKCGQLRKEQV